MNPSELIADFERQIESCQKNISALNSALVRENQKLLKLQGAVEGLNMLEDPVVTKGSSVEPFSVESPYHQPVEQPTTTTSEED